MESVKNDMINSPTILTGMSHELRTNMNAIVAFSYLMKENGSNNSEREEFNYQIISACEQLIELFDSFLDSAIVGTGSSKVDSKSCNLSKLIDDLFSEFRDIMRKKGKSEVELLTEIGLSDWTEVMIDPNRISRIIRSLFQNSLKNTSSGYIKIGFFFRDEKLTFYVLDSSQGYLKFREFLYSDDLNESLSQYYDLYTAININLIRKLIKMIGGDIWIERNGLSGAGIYFSMPMKIITYSDINTNRIISSMITI
jgi:light-regulated signal transduction histidine kinase (bacteriophytochrome)